MIKIAITTNKNFFEKSLPILIPTLIDCGINKDDIHVFNAGFDKYSKGIVNGITYHNLDHNSFEYSALIEICEKEIVSEYWFLIHDTCKVGKKFKELLYNIPEEKPVKMALKINPSMSMGLYSYNYLLENKNKLFHIKNSDYSKESMSKWKIWGVPNEDYIMWKTEPKPKLYNENEKNWSVVDNYNWYGTDTIRRTEYYPSLDLYKNKSNWGQTGYNMVLKI
jgi:hypothetical protein